MVLSSLPSQVEGRGAGAACFGRSNILEGLNKQNKTQDGGCLHGEFQNFKIILATVLCCSKWHLRISPAWHAILPNLSQTDEGARRAEARQAQEQGKEGRSYQEGLHALVPVKCTARAA